jgi:two-component system response regulator PilR (NtrC family)
MMPVMDGYEVCRRLKANPETADIPVLFLSGRTAAEDERIGLEIGAEDYLAKPVSLEQLRSLVKSALSLPAPVQARIQSDQGLIGNSPIIHHVREMIDKLARSEAPVHVTGESGSGKELAARLIHQKSARRDKPFVPVNCGAIPENLMESEFFGYRKGAFTGADADRDGFFQAAHGGTLFLDEVADLPLPMQVKLLRAIQEKKVRKVGYTQEEAVDVRIISATHQSLSECVEAGKFRHDLYYRLNVIELRMPALRDRREDVPMFAELVLDRLTRNLQGPRPVIEPGAMRALQQYDFPGNVRELENILERALALCSNGRITEDDLQITPPEAVLRESAPAGTTGKWPLQDYLDRVEREAIMEALDKTRFNRTAAAKLLGITFRSIRYRMERLGIE